MKNIRQNLFITSIIMIICTIVSYLFVYLNIRIENIIMIYLIGVLFIVIQTKELAWGIISSCISIITFNYCFTQPVYSLQIYDPSYVVTILIFLIVSLITGSLVNKMQQHAYVSKSNEERSLAFYEISKKYLNLSGIDAILIHNIHSLYEYQGIRCIIYYYRSEEDRLVEYRKESILKGVQADINLATWSFDHVKKCGYNTKHLKENEWTYFPLHRNDRLFGVFAVYQPMYLNEDNIMFMNTLISQMVMAIERELLYEEQERNKIEIEKEKLRNNLLRSISHDLRTPLTGIAGSSSLMIDNYSEIDDETKLNLLKSISSDAVWLTQLVENLLNMTRIQDGKLMISKQKEVVDDIICEAARHCESRKGEHQIEAHLPKDVILVEMDGKLIVQVLVNFIDNAIKHTQDDSCIDISFHLNKKKAYFEVSDNGDGFDVSLSDKLFESFVTTKRDRADSKRGVGLGLPICKSIVEAHNGEIFAYNRTDTKGAVFGFVLPYSEEATS